jgi:hypothetical protein
VPYGPVPGTAPDDLLEKKLQNRKQTPKSSQKRLNQPQLMMHVSCCVRGGLKNNTSQKYFNTQRPGVRALSGFNFQEHKAANDLVKHAMKTGTMAGIQFAVEE